MLKRLVSSTTFTCEKRILFSTHEYIMSIIYKKNDENQFDNIIQSEFQKTKKKSVIRIELTIVIVSLCFTVAKHVMQEIWRLYLSNMGANIGSGGRRHGAAYGVVLRAARNEPMQAARRARCVHYPCHRPLCPIVTASAVPL
jgi:hypothetical protein